MIYLSLNLWLYPILLNAIFLAFLTPLSCSRGVRSNNSSKLRPLSSSMASIFRTPWSPTWLCSTALLSPLPAKPMSSKMWVGRRASLSFIWQLRFFQQELGSLVYLFCMYLGTVQRILYLTINGPLNLAFSLCLCFGLYITQPKLIKISLRAW